MNIPTNVKQVLLHIVIAFAVAFIFFRFLMDFFIPFIIGLGIALLLEPLVHLLIRRGRFRRPLASFVALLIFVLFGFSIGRWGVMALYREATELLEAAPAYISELQEWLANFQFIPASGILDRAGEWIGTQSIRAVRVVPGALIGVLLVLVSAFFFLRDREMIFGLIARLMDKCPDRITQYIRPVGLRLHHAAIGFLKSEGILFAMVASVCVVILWMLGSPYAIMLGLTIALFDSLPIVGSGLILWPWAGYQALQGNHPQAAGLMILFGIVTVIRNVIGPRILGEQIDMHPLAAIMSIFIGIKIFGPVGILAGPALVIAGRAMYSTNPHLKP